MSSSPASPVGAATAAAKKERPIPTSTLMQKTPFHRGNVTRGYLKEFVERDVVKEDGSLNPDVFRELSIIKSDMDRRLKQVEKKAAAEMKPKMKRDQLASAQNLYEFYFSIENIGKMDGVWLACSLPGEASKIHFSVLDSFNTLEDMTMDGIEPEKLSEKLHAKVVEGWTAYRAAKDKGLQPLGICSEKMVDGEYTVTKTDDWDEEDEILHVGSTKSMVNGHMGESATEFTPPSSVWEKKAVPVRVKPIVPLILNVSSAIRKMLSIDADAPPTPKTEQQIRAAAKRAEKKAAEEAEAAAVAAAGKMSRGKGGKGLGKGKKAAPPTVTAPTAAAVPAGPDAGTIFADSPPPTGGSTTGPDTDTSPLSVDILPPAKKKRTKKAAGAAAAAAPSSSGGKKKGRAAGGTKRGTKRARTDDASGGDVAVTVAPAKRSGNGGGGGKRARKAAAGNV